MTVKVNQDVLICFVLDQSGSMLSVVDATCEGFNQFKTEQKAQEGETLMTLTLFNTMLDMRFTAESLAVIPDLGLTHNKYRPGGGTALFDAVGDSIKRTERWVAAHNWTGRVMVVILTDGQENSSTSWHIRNPRVDGDSRDVAGLIDWKQNEDWNFVFMGAGGTEWLEKTFFTLPRDVFYGYDGDAASTRKTYATMSAATTQSRYTGQSLASAMAEQKSE